MLAAAFDRQQPPIGSSTECDNRRSRLACSLYVRLRTIVMDSNDEKNCEQNSGISRSNDDQPPGGDVVGRRNRHGAAFAATRYPDNPLRATLGEEAFPYGSDVEATVEKTTSDSEVRVALHSDGSTVVHARSSIGVSGAMSRDGDVMAGAVGEQCRTSVNRQAGDATSSAWGRHDARAIALGDGRGAMASASVATAAGGQAKATGNNARAFSFSPGGVGGMPPFLGPWTTFQNPTLPPPSEERWYQRLLHFGAALLGTRPDIPTVTETPPPATAPAGTLPSSLAEEFSRKHSESDQPKDK